ncbi:MAG: hypothetical protein EXS19_05100 [Pedosphaera sp.]|nr:hypothetical protein [Pedosphaera sp.]
MRTLPKLALLLFHLGLSSTFAADAPKPVDFPPIDSARRVGGELISADFTMPPHASAKYLNAEADLRDVPLGTRFLFFLNQDSRGGFSRLATMQDQFTEDATASVSYRLEEVKPGEGKLIATKRGIAKQQDVPGRKEWLVNDERRMWMGGRQVKLSDLAVGDALPANLTGELRGAPSRCTDIWIGAETRKLVTAQRSKNPEKK